MKATLTKRVENLEGRMDSIESKIDQLLELQTSSKKKSAPKDSAKSIEKKEASEKKTWEEHLEESFGTKEDRKDFAVLRGRVNDEWKKIRREGGFKRSIPNNKYKTILDEFTRSLNGKWNQKAVEEGFMNYSKEKKSA